MDLVSAFRHGSRQLRFRAACTENETKLKYIHTTLQRFSAAVAIFLALFFFCIFAFLFSFFLFPFFFSSRAIARAIFRSRGEKECHSFNCTGKRDNGPGRRSSARADNAPRLSNFYQQYSTRPAISYMPEQSRGGGEWRGEGENFSLHEARRLNRFLRNRRSSRARALCSSFYGSACIRRSSAAPLRT